MPRLLPLCVAVLAVLGLSLSAADRPNILMIVSDDHAWFDYGFMGSKAVSTPHLDKLAADSRAFPRGYVTNSLCGPSLASMLTGRHVHRHGLTGNDPFIPAVAGAKGAGKAAANKQKNAAFLEGRAQMIKRFQESPILPRLLGEQGYVSLQTGKWWMGPYQTGGFTEGMTKGGRHGDDGLDIGRKTLAPLTDFISRAKKDGKPFFAWYAPMMPHDPHTPPERLLAKYRDKSPSLHAAKYHAMVEWFDETIGEIRAHLEKEGLTRDTIIVYVADNGWIPRTDKPGVDFERSKQSPFDGGVRTPIFVSWPGRIKPALMTEAASAVDIMPTLLKLAGAPRARRRRRTRPARRRGPEGAPVRRRPELDPRHPRSRATRRQPALPLARRRRPQADRLQRPQDRWHPAGFGRRRRAAAPLRPQGRSVRTPRPRRRTSEDVKRLMAQLDGWWTGR
jgi:arylsulfatase A-like enzyme